MTGRLQLTYTERSELATNGVAKRLYAIMSEKETNLCLALDEPDSNRFLMLAETIAPEIAVLKTHVDTIEGYSGKITVELSNLAREHNFMIFEDRKFADVGHTVKSQYTKGVFHIIEWADIVNAHAISGPGLVEGLKEEVVEYNMLDKRALLLSAQMSTSGNFIDNDYTERVVELARKDPDFVMGFIGAGADSIPFLAGITPAEFLIFAPGVKIGESNASYGQRYDAPEAVITAGADVIIVGRDIFNDPRPLAKARQYKDIGWKTYQTRIQQSKVRSGS